MIRKLRRKFILLPLLAMALVLATIIGIANIAAYVSLDSDANQTLALLLENDGMFPNAVSDMPVHAHVDDPLFRRDDSNRAMSVEKPFETRFFTVEISDNSAILSTGTDNIAAISAADAQQIALSLFARGKTAGYYQTYKYGATETDNGILYVFLDCRRELFSFRRFLGISVLVSLIGMLAVFLLVVLFSKRAIAPVVESYEKQKRFITDAGHEIKTPLTIIDSCTEVLELEQGENKWTGSIRNQVHRLTDLTENLVALSRMDESNTRLMMVDFSLSDAVSESAEPFFPVAATRGKELLCDIEPGLSYCGDEVAIRRLVNILLDNAVKYALPDAPIELGLHRRGRVLALTCKNAAQGLDRGDLSCLFDRFYRADASRSSSTGGSGIGLSLAQSIVQAHKARISAKNADGKTLLITVLF